MIISGQSVELFISDIILHNVAACERQTSLRHLYIGRERLIRSHSSARFCFELSGNLN